MSALADIPELGTLRDKAEHVRDLIVPAPPRPAGEDAEQVREQRRCVYAEVEDGILDLSNALPRGTEDYDVRKLLEFLVGLRRAIEADPDGTDARGEVELHKLMMGDVLRRIDRRLLHDQLDDPRAAADSLFTTLDRIPAGDLARLLGVSTKTIGAWKAGRPVARNVERVVVLAQLVSYLRSSLTPLGIVLWFDAPRDQLAGRTPLDLLDAGVAAAREPLVSLARGARGQLAGWPTRLAGEWRCFRQVAPDWPPLYHAAGEPAPSQRSARWHRVGEGYAQYLALEPMGAWAELVRFERIRGGARAEQYRRRLWLVFAREREIADLSTFDRWADCGLDPRAAVGDHAACQEIADDLRAAGYRGVLAPSAALVGATNLTLFGARYEKVLLGGLESWDNPNPELRLPCSLVAEGTPPEQLITETTFLDMPHDGYRGWLRSQGLRAPRGAP